MLVWPANSWLFWAVAAVGVGLYFGVILCLRRQQGVFLKRPMLVGILLAGVIVLTAIAPSVLFSALSTTAFNVAPQDAAWWSISAIVGIAAIVLGAWALFADRSRGRKRCPKCWYDLSGTPTLTCPECGKAAKHEKRLYRTRRRKRWAALAALLLIGAVCGAAWPTARNTDWEQATPDWVLLLAMPHLDGDEWLAERLEDRASLPGGSLLIEFMDAKVPAWKRKLAVWRSRTTLSEGGTRFGATVAFRLADEFTDDEVSLMADVAAARCKDADSRIRVRAISLLRRCPSFYNEAQDLAIDLLHDVDDYVQLAAVVTLASIARQQAAPPTPPRELLDIARNGSGEAADRAMWALGFYQPSPQVVELLENNLGKSSDCRILSPLVRLEPESAVAREVALRELRQDTDQLHWIARALYECDWRCNEVEAAFIEAVGRSKSTSRVQLALEAITLQQHLSVGDRLEILLRIGHSESTRGLVAGSVRDFGREGKAVLPRLRQIAAEWEKVDPIAATSLRDSIRNIESQPE